MRSNIQSIKIHLLSFCSFLSQCSSCLSVRFDGVLSGFATPTTISCASPRLVFLENVQVNFGLISLSIDFVHPLCSLLYLMSCVNRRRAVCNPDPFGHQHSTVVSNQYSTIHRLKGCTDIGEQVSALHHNTPSKPNQYHLSFLILVSTNKRRGENRLSLEHKTHSTFSYPSHKTITQQHKKDFTRRLPLTDSFVKTNTNY